MDEITHLINYRNNLQDNVYKLLEGEYTTVTKHKINKLYKDIDKVNRRIKKIERLESNGIFVYEPSDFI